MSVPLLELRAVSKSYGGVPAVQRLDLLLRAGEVHALLGENGAGKSTIAKMIAGVTTMDAGELHLRGTPTRLADPAAARAAGIAMVYQETSLVDTMTVAQNLFLGSERRFNRRSQLNIEARALLAAHNFHLEPSAPAAALGAAQKQMVEIARAVNRSAAVVIFDEPTAAVTPEEKQQLFLSMDQLKRRGVGMLFITHNLEEALDHADVITVLRDGMCQATGPTEEFDRQRIVSHMVGRTVEYARLPPGRPPGVQPRLKVEGLTLGRVVKNLSFSAYPGEIVGLAGLVGAGRTEASKVVYGALKRRRLRGGTVRVDGQRVRFRTPRDGLRRGVAYVPEDRKAEGIFPDLTIEDNIQVGRLAAMRRIPVLARRRRLRALARSAVDEYQIRSLNPTRSTVGELSGGNQQKVVLAKALAGDARVVIFDEPTRGVDVGAIEEIHRLIRALADQGAAVVLISSYLPEILALSDRILVARQGTIVSEFAPHEATEEAILFAAVH